MYGRRDSTWNADSQPEQSTHRLQLIRGVCVQMKRVFIEFAQFGTRSEAKTMDVYRFTKLCRECDLLAQPQDTPSIHLIFYKVRIVRCLPQDR